MDNKPSIDFVAPCTLTPRNDSYPFISPTRFGGRLANQTVVLTGAGRGIGRTSSLAFAAAGANVVCVARRQADIDRVVAEIKQKHPETKPLAVAADVADPNAGKAIVDRAEREIGPVDILVNNAGMTRYRPFTSEPSGLQRWWRVMEVNLYGPVALVHAVLPSMMERGTGTIISLASTSGSQDVPFNAAYAVSKAALIKFHQDLEVEVRRYGVKTFSVHLGTVQTDLATVEGAVDMDAVMSHPDASQVLAAFGNIEYQTPQLAADTFVALCANEDLKVLSGRYIDSQFDLGEVLEDVKKGKESRVLKEKLYRLNVHEL